jgi:hypothetical protein
VTDSRGDHGVTYRSATWIIQGGWSQGAHWPNELRPRTARIDDLGGCGRRGVFVGRGGLAPIHALRRSTRRDPGVSCTRSRDADVGNQKNGFGRRVIARFGGDLARSRCRSGRLGTQCLLLLTALGPSDLERDRRQCHERSSWPGSGLRALARAGLGTRPRFASGASLTSRTETFAGYAAILCLIGLWTVMTARHARWLTLPGAIASLTRRRGVRIVVVLGWVWLGWHLFARGSGAFK